jgi:hypothetical protein
MKTRTITDATLIESGREELARLLPPRWRVGVATPPEAFLVSSPSGVEARLMADPRADATPGMLAAEYTGVPAEPTVVVARYLSPRSRAVLESKAVFYVDLTGNAWLSIDNPGLALRTDGAQRDPAPRARPDRGISGKVAGRVIRALTDFSPPYTVTELAGIAEVSPGYCSRTLQALEREALVHRDRRGTVQSVDWQDMLRRRGQIIRLFDPRRSSGWIARAGMQGALNMLTDLDPDTYAVTGPFAAGRVRVVAAPAGLVVYATNPQTLARDLDLIPADVGADIRLIAPTGAGEMLRPRTEDGIVWVGLSQVVIDCMGGPGRMPQEGEAVLDWMTANVSAWRIEPELNSV